MILLIRAGVALVACDAHLPERSRDLCVRIVLRQWP